MPTRLEAWARLARDLDRVKLARMTRTVAFEQTFDIGARILAGQVRGRVVVAIA
jgi:acrylyl-CoA reductase (NADPH)